MSAPNAALLWSILKGDVPASLSPDQLDPLLDLAAAHGLVGMIVEALNKQGKAIPEWQALAEELEIKGKVKLQAAAEIAAALRESKVEAAFVKGVALALTVYGGPGVRTFADLDLLVLPERLAHAHAVLVKLGFALRDTAGSSIEASYLRERLPGLPVCVDLHWDFAAADSLQAALRVPVAEVLERSRIVSAVPIPADEDNLLLAATNLARKSAEPLMLIVDFARLAQQPVNWGRVGERARAWRVRTPLWLGLRLAEQLLAVRVSPAVYETVTPPRWRAERLENLLAGERLWLSDKQQRWRYRILFKLLCLDSWWDVLATGAALPKRVLRKLGLASSPARELQRP